MQSIWNYFANGAQHFQQLDKDISTDVLVIGGGITGISTAHALMESGLHTTVIEALEVGGGTTAHSTGNLYATTDKNLLKLKNKYDLETLQVLVSSRFDCIGKIEQNIQKYELECDFQRTPWFLYSMGDEAMGRIESEFSVAKALKLPVEKESEGLPYKPKASMKILNQAQINGRMYVQQLAEKLDSRKVNIYENTQAQNIEEKENHIEVLTHQQHKIKTKYLVHATHIPKGVKSIQHFMAPYREYGVAFKVPESQIKRGIFWGYHGEENFISSRFYTHDKNHYLMVVGEPHKVGQADSGKAIHNLKKFAKEHFNIEKTDFQWGGQHYRPVDFLPFIGREKEGSNVFLATGFSTDGLVYGVLAGEIISELLNDENSEIAEILRPDRNDYLKGMKKAVSENANVLKQYLKDIPHWKDDEEIGDLEKESGKVIERNGEKLAIYKDELDRVRACSAVCTHMKCIINWNASEKSWDCPCHGSRFDSKGKVIEGPALHNLHSREDY